VIPACLRDSAIQAVTIPTRSSIRGAINTPKIVGFHMNVAVVDNQIFHAAPAWTICSRVADFYVGTKFSFGNHQPDVAAPETPAAIVSTLRDRRMPWIADRENNLRTPNNPGRQWLREALVDVRIRALERLEN